MPQRSKREESLNYKVVIQKNILQGGKPKIAQMAGGKSAFNPKFYCR